MTGPAGLVAKRAALERCLALRVDRGKLPMGPRHCVVNLRAGVQTSGGSRLGLKKIFTDCPTVGVPKRMMRALLTLLFFSLGILDILAEECEATELAKSASLIQERTEATKSLAKAAPVIPPPEGIIPPPVGPDFGGPDSGVFVTTTKVPPKNTTTTTMMMTTATTTKTAHSGSPGVQTPTAWLLFVAFLLRWS
eukprot:symbB.v1.2.007220.t1/scaffold441.1/size205278/7